MDDYEKAFSPRTKMVALTHMSNALGTITPAQEIVRIAHNNGVPVLLDGCQASVHLTVDVQDLNVDFYVFSGHKVYGPTGIGVLYGKSEHLKTMRPYRGGGEMIGGGQPPQPPDRVLEGHCVRYPLCEQSGGVIGARK
jgi:cysteine desulfurase/selenocysteine lyase